MKRIFFFTLFLLLNSLQGFSQCLTIENLLADACGDPEGENEMVRFKVGATDLNIQDIDFDWPNNAFRDWCPEPTKTAQLNATITSSCGWLLEPTNNILPAGSQVIVISSTDFNVSFNSFEGLVDTFYIIYQCAGNTAGHFSNLANSNRTLVINVTGSCTGDYSATYKGTDLIGGDGAAVEFNNGVRTYVNYGCNAPVPNYEPVWTFTDKICQDYGDVVLSDLAQSVGDNATVAWSGNGVTGNIFNPAGLLGEQSITYSVISTNPCIPSSDSTITFEVDTINILYDTISVCDTFPFEGNVLRTSQEVQIDVTNFTEYGCDEIIYRYVDILKATYTVNPSETTIDSGDSLEYWIDNIDQNLQYEWTNTLGESCTNNCESHLRPIDGTTYTFMFTDNETGCSNEDKIKVNLIYYSELNIPTGFTPNGDGENDFFKAYGQDIREFSLQIFDRFGGTIFTTDKINHLWNGESRGKPVESGAYIAYVKARGKDGRQFDFYEKIILVR